MKFSYISSHYAPEKFLHEIKSKKSHVEITMKKNYTRLYFFYLQMILDFCEFYGVTRSHTIDCEINKASSTSNKTFCGQCKGKTVSD